MFRSEILLAAALFAAGSFLRADTLPGMKTVFLEEKFSTQEDIDLHWELMSPGGAEGKAGIDGKVVTPDDNPALRLEKTNNRGVLVLKFRKDLRALPAGLYRIQGRYHTENASPGSFLAFRFLRGKRDPRFYEVRTNSGDVGVTYSTLVNSPAGKWQNSCYYFRIAEKERNRENFHIALLLAGEPCAVSIESVMLVKLRETGERFPGKNGTAPALRFEKGSRITKEEALKRTRTRRPASIELKRFGRGLQFLLDGRPAAPVFYMLQCPNSRPHNMEMFEHGVRIHEVYCCAGGSRRRGFNVLTETPGKYDFTTCEDQILTTLAKAPGAVLVLRLCTGSYPGLESDPDEIWQNRDGLFGVSSSGDNMLAVRKFVKEKKPGEYYYPSYASVKWRRICCDAFVAYIRHLQKTGLFNAVAGFEFEIGEDGQFLTTWNKRDFCPAVRRGFGEFLRKKYGTPENLRKAWRDPKASFDFPTRESLPGFNGLPRKDILDPAVDMPIMDALRYHNEMQLEMVEYFRKRIAEASGRPMYFRVMHPANMYKSWCDMVSGGETRIDALRDCIFYSDRRPGRPAAPTVALDTARENLRLCVEELDLRTFSDRKADSFADDSVGRATTPAMFRAILARNTGYMIAKSMGYVYYDMNQYFAQCREVLDEIRLNSLIADRVLKKKDTFKPDVAVIFDNEAAFYSVAAGARSKLALRMPLFFAHCLYASGVPFDMFYMRDFLKNPRKRGDYKIVVFVSALNLDEAGRKAVSELKNSGRVLCFLYPAGLTGAGPGLSEKAAARLMGIGIVRDGRENLMLEPAGDSPLVRNAGSLWGTADLLELRVWPHDGSKLPRFIVQDDKARIIGRFTSDGAPGAAVRVHSDWTSVYIGSPDGLSAGLMHNLAKAYKCFTAVDKPGLDMAMRGNFISAHALRGGTYTFRFPQKGTIVASLTGKVLAENADTVTLPLDAGETLWLEQQ
ncbi:MAG: hypothetical protein IJU70_07680 [Lentisphaeria bacterium]|nr:hypothetical protein [Lentisphaeria bacterium]